MNRRCFLKNSALMAVALSSVTARAATSSGRPNLVFVEVDDLMYRFMGKLGRQFAHTPNIDALAGDGVYFTHAVCQGMMCGPSRNSLVTGLYPHNLGFYRNGQMGPLPKGVWSLPGALRRCGYATAWVGKCHVHPPEAETRLPISEALQRTMGLDHAVASAGRAVLRSRVLKAAPMADDVYIQHLKRHGLLELYINDCKTRKRVTSLPEEHYLDGYYTHRALDWLDGYRDSKPFFLWLNLSCPHGPHDVPQKYHDLYRDKEIPGPLTSSFGDAIPEGLLKDNKPAKPGTLDETRRGFAAATTFVDAMLGKVLDKLRDKGHLDNSVIVFFSDHGIFMGNHGRVHKGSVFNEITNPCLIVHYPRGFKRGVVEKTPVELLGLVRTALDIAEAPPNEKRTPFGESLMPLLTGRGSFKTKYVFSEIEGFQSCFDGHYRYIANKETPLLYDLRNDPGEMKNVAKDKPDVAATMQAATNEWLKATGPVLPAGHLRDPANLDRMEERIRQSKS